MPRALIFLCASIPWGFSRLESEEPPRRMVIIQPGYPGSTEDAAGFLKKLAAYLEAKAGLQAVSGEYYNEEKKALQSLEEKKASFGLVSAGFYLEHREGLGLRALLQSKPKDNFLVVARAGDVKDASALRGQPVAGGPLHEARFLERIVFSGTAEVASWEAKPTLHASRALRDLVDRRKYRAVVLTGRDYGAFKELYAKRLEKVVESDYYPPAFLVIFHLRDEEETKRGEKAGGEESKKSGRELSLEGKANAGPPALSDEALKRIVRAFRGLHGDPQGKEILETMGAEGFEEVRADWLHELEGKYDVKRERK